jgi:hypothetical protein
VHVLTAGAWFVLVVAAAQLCVAVAVAMTALALRALR